MSVLELSQQTQVRLPKIKVGLLQRKSREQIGINCHVSERTIRRDIEAWTRTPDFEQWLNEAWLHEYQYVNHSEAFRALTALMGKKITRKIEATTEAMLTHVEETRNVTILADYTSAIEEAVNRDIEALRARKQVDTAQAHS